MFLRFAVLGFVCGMLSGCIVPFPHIEHHAPLITGTIKNGDQPIADVVLELTPLNDEVIWAKSQTDGGGRFEIGPVSEPRLTVMLGVDYFCYYYLHVTLRGERYLGFKSLCPGNASILNPEIGPKKIDLVCDLAKRRETEFPEGFCEEVDDSE